MLGLTDAQRQAVMADSPALCVLAGAGSGKTRVLTLRVVRRIADGSAEADHTAVCTFTRKAAVELRQRLVGFGVSVSRPGGQGAAPSPGVRAGTLHQLALTLLKRHAADNQQAPPQVAEQRFGILRQLTQDPALAGIIDLEVGWAKSRGITPQEYASEAGKSGRTPQGGVEAAARHFAAYEASLAKRRLLDLDDVLIRAADAITEDTGFAERVHWRYRHLSVDEFQDVNPAQFRLVRALLGQTNDLCAVGDPNQAIYGWNGADVSLIGELPALIPGIEVVRLDENHRCTPQVVAAATAALGPTVATPPRSATAPGPMPVLTTYDSDRSEASGVAEAILDHLADGAAPSDLAVLARTNDLLAGVARELRAAGVPHRLAPGPEAPAQEEDGPAVELATFHRAKGLEWRAVWIVGLEEGFVPIVHAQTDAALDEERRLLYVALTRASTELFCSWAKERRMGNGRQMERSPSPWLAAIARVARRGSGRAPRRDASQRFAELRANLGS